MLPEKPSWCRNEHVCQEGQQSVKTFERSNGLDTALYKNYLLLPLSLESPPPVMFVSITILIRFYYDLFEFAPDNAIVGR